jgi:two-component system chemotaxis response regulator CheY
MSVDTSMQVLIVDDYPAMIRIIRGFLNQFGFRNVDECFDGKSAWDRAKTGSYGLIIADWNMAPMTGYELLQKIRAEPRTEETPFIMITAESKTEYVVMAKKAGVSNYIVKPFNASTLRDKMRAVLGDF